MNDKIKEWATGLAVRLTEIRFYEIEQMTVAIQTHIKAAIYDCLKYQIPEIERERNSIIQQIKGGENQKHIESKLAKINERIKEQNLLRTELENDKKLKELILWMRKHHEDSLLEFYKQFDR